MAQLIRVKELSEGSEASPSEVIDEKVDQEEHGPASDMASNMKAKQAAAFHHQAPETERLETIAEEAYEVSPEKTQLGH